MIDLVAAAYRGILSRDPDPAGLETWTDRLERNPPEVLFSGLVASREFQRRYLLNQVKAGGPEAAKKITNYLVHLQIGGVLHAPRVDLVRNYLPPGAKVLDLGGASGRPEGALLEMGYAHAADVTIVDLPLDRRFKAGPDIDSEFEHNGTTVRYAYHSMADLSYYDDNSFDLVWSGQTYEHITEAEGRDLFPQIVRVLKPGGIFAMDTPNRTITRVLMDEGEWVHAEHKIEYEYEDFVRRFVGQGLDLIDRRGILDMPDTLRCGHGVMAELQNNTVNETPETSYCFYLAFRKA